MYTDEGTGCTKATIMMTIKIKQKKFTPAHEDRNNTDSPRIITLKSESGTNRQGCEGFSAASNFAAESAQIVGARRAAKISLLKQQLRSGEYRPDLNAVAESLLKFVRHQT